MTFDESYRWLQIHGLDIGQLALNGYELAKHVILAYQEWHVDKLNPMKQAKLLKLVNEMALASLTDSELAELQRLYGFKLHE